ncbi:MAG: hypothetical protein ACOVQE_07605 [Chitinophagaceae bacterium]
MSSVTFTDAEKSKVSKALQDLKEVLVAKTTNLTDAERTLYGSVNEQNKLLLQKVNQYAVSNPEIVPTHIDKAELDRDYESRDILEIWEDALKLQLSNVQNTKILLDFDVYQSVLSIYRNVKYLAGEDVPGMNAIYNDLKQFFPGGRPNADAKTDA